MAEIKNSFHGGGYGPYQSYRNIKGFRDVIDRDNLVRDKLKAISFNGGILDIGCNIGISLHHAIDDGFCTSGYGVDVDEGFIEYGKKIIGNKNINLERGNFTQMARKDMDVIDLCLDGVKAIFLYSVWDYFSVSSGVLKVDPGEGAAIKNLKYLCPDIILFEGHADGEDRIANDIISNGNKHESWKSILTDKLNVKKYELLGMTDNNRRPLFYCEMI